VNGDSYGLDSSFQFQDLFYGVRGAIASVVIIVVALCAQTNPSVIRLANILFLGKVLASANLAPENYLYQGEFGWPKEIHWTTFGCTVTLHTHQTPCQAHNPPDSIEKFRYRRLLRELQGMLTAFQDRVA
jgi:hypothetical protein